MMQKPSILLFVFLLVFSSHCSQKQDAPEIKFDLRGESKLTFHNSSKAPIQIKFEKWSSIPMDFEDVDTLLNPGSSFKVTLKNQNMDYIYLNLNKAEHDIFMVPGSDETLTIFEKDSIGFSGSLSAINQFLYQNSNKGLGFNKLNHAHAMATHGEKDFKHFVKISDSLHQVQAKNLEAYKSHLPEWYVKIEKERSAYKKVSYKMNSISYRSNMLKIEDDIPEGYLEDLAHSVQLENEILIGESSYMNFLNEYSNFQSRKKTNLDTSMNSKQPLIVQMAEEIEQLFSGNVKDAFLAFTTSMLIKNMRWEYDSLVLEYFEGEEFRDFIREYYVSSVTLQPGKAMPYFYLENPFGEFKTSKDYRGNILLINFWADWCKPCIEEFPHENALVEKYKDKPVRIVNICIESKPLRWKDYIQKYGLKMDNLFAEENWTRKLKNDFGILGIPHSVLIDWNGNIVENKTKTASKGIDELIDLLLEKMKSEGT